MGGQFTLELDDDERHTVYASYGIFEQLKGCLIRAAVKYLIIISAKNVSKQLLIDEHIIDPDSDEARFPEDIIIPNYRFRIDSAIYPLQSWCRRPTGSDYWEPPKFTTNEHGAVPLEQVSDAIQRSHRRWETWKNGPRPMADSIAPAGVSLSWFYDVLGDSNYFIDRIPVTLPPVLRELKLQGLHTYLSHSGELDFEQSQEVVAFLDKVEDYVRVDEFFADDEEEPIVEQLRALFAACPEDKIVTFG
jgi:hypothetical protein